MRRTIFSPFTNVAVGTTAPILTQAEIQEIIEEFVEVTDDGVITTSEKVRTLIPTVEELDALSSRLIALATLAGVSHSALSSAKSAFMNYLNSLTPAWNDKTQDTVVNRETLLNLLKNYTSAIANLQGKGALANSLHDLDPIADDSLQDIIADSVLSTTEKTGLLLEHKRAMSQWTQLDAKADSLGGLGAQRTAALNAKNALNSHLESLTPAWDDPQVNTPIPNTALFRSLWEDFYVAVAVLEASVTGAPGTPGLGAYLTNESHTVVADNDGNVSSFSGAEGQFIVYYGGENVTNLCTFSEVLEIGLTGQINTSTNSSFTGPKGAYRVTSMSADAGVYRIQASFNPGTGTPLVVTKDFNVAKSRGGANAKVLTVVATRQTFSFNSSSQLVGEDFIRFDSIENNLTGTRTWTARKLNASGVDIGAATLHSNSAGTTSSTSSNPIYLKASQFTENVEAIKVTATMGDHSDVVTVIKVLDGVDGVSGVINKNSAFGKWPTGKELPLNWSYNGPDVDATREPGLVDGSNGIRINGGASSSTAHGSIYQQIGTAGANSVLDGQYYVIEADVRLESGNFHGAGVLLQFYNSSGHTINSADRRIDFEFDPDTRGSVGVGTTGILYRFRKTIRISSPGARYAIIYANSHSVMHTVQAGTTSGMSPNSIIWYQCSVRTANDAEIAVYNGLSPDGTIKANIPPTIRDSSNILGRTGGGVFTGELAADVTAGRISAGIAGQGSLATKNNVTWTSEVTGTGKPANNADVTASNVASGISGQGWFATQDTVAWGSRITGGNRPADNAGTTLILVDKGGNDFSIQGNTITKTSGAHFDNAFTAGAPMRGSFYASFRIRNTGDRYYFGISTSPVIWKTDAATQMNFGFYLNSGQLRTGASTGSIADQSYTSNSLFEVICDGRFVRLYVDGVQTTTGGVPDTLSVGANTTFYLFGLIQSHTSYISDIIFGPYGIVSRVGVNTYSQTGGALDASDLITSSGVSAAISGQGALATRSNVRFGQEIYRSNGTWLVNDADVITSSGVSAGIAGQGAGATANSLQELNSSDWNRLVYSVPIEWDVNNMVPVGARVTREGAGGDWGAAAVIRTQARGQFSFTFRIVTNLRAGGGISLLNQNAAYVSSMAAGFLKTNNTTVGIYETGTNPVYTQGGVTQDTVFCIESDGVNVYYYIDNVLVRTRSVGALAWDHTSLLYAKAMGYNGGGGITVLNWSISSDYGRSRGHDTNGRMTNQRYLPMISAAGGRYKFNGNITYSAPSTSSTVSVGAGTILLGSQTVSYNAMSVGVNGARGTTVTYYLYVDDPNYEGGSKTLAATTSENVLYQNDGRVALGVVSIYYPSSGTGDGGGGWGGGGFYRPQMPL